MKTVRHTLPLALSSFHYRTADGKKYTPPEWETTELYGSKPHHYKSERVSC
jgi:hypothetical protein